MNKEILLQAADSIEREYASNGNHLGFDMRTYGQQGTCGTVACVAGHIVANTNPARYFKLLDEFGGVTAFGDAAAILGVNHEDALKLFVPEHMYAAINKNVKLVPDALRWMAMTGDLDWRKALKAAACVKEKVVS